MLVKYWINENPISLSIKFITIFDLFFDFNLYKTELLFNLLKVFNKLNISIIDGIFSRITSIELHFKIGSFKPFFSK